MIFICRRDQIDSSYLDAQFEIQVINTHHIEKTETKMETAREGLIIKILKAFEGDISETIYLELTISKKLNS